MKHPISNSVRTRRQPAKWLQWILNALTAFGQTLLVATGLASIFISYIWERTTFHLTRHHTISAKSAK